MERLQDNQQIKEYFRMLQENDRQRQAGEYQALLEQIDNLEWQLETVGKELKSLRSQLAKADRGTVERSMKTAARRAGREVKVAKEHIREIKRSILSGMGKAVREVKRSGAAALDKAVDKLHIRVMLRNISMGMERSSIYMQETIDRITAAGEEAQRAKIHKKNASRVLFGKEQEKVPEKPELGVTARSAARSFAAVKGLCDEIRKQADGLEERMVRLSGRVEMNREEVNRRQQNSWQQQDGQSMKAELIQNQGAIQSLREYRRSHKKEDQQVNKRKGMTEGMNL